MTKMVFIHEIEDVTKWLEMVELRKKVLGRFAKDIEFHPDGDVGNQVALTMDVHDLEGLRSYSRSAEGQAQQEKGGNVRQVAYFTHLT